MDVCVHAPRPLFMYVHLRTCVHVCVLRPATRTQEGMHARMNACASKLTRCRVFTPMVISWAFMHMHMDICMYAHTHILMYVCVCVRVCVRERARVRVCMMP